MSRANASLALPVFCWVWKYRSRFFVAAAIATLFAWLLFPDQRLVGTFLVTGTRAAVVVGLLLWLLMQLVRRRRPGLKLVDVISESTDWPRFGTVDRVAVAVLFAGVVLVYSSLGAMVGGLAGVGVIVLLTAA